ncbi:hypothetical protein, partial [Staphylococcus hominis]|uniref:hypothetical protein n=1 Tax=Staphylococcus hominis TaxID=1290 RepID=UPI0016434D51
QTPQQPLQPIKQFTQLRSPFKIPMPHLNIPPPANLLPNQQHRFIHSLPFHFYSQILQQPVNEKPPITQQTPHAPHLQMELHLHPYLPPHYIQNQQP